MAATSGAMRVPSEPLIITTSPACTMPSKAASSSVEVGAQADAGGARGARRRHGQGRPAGSQPPGEIAGRAIVRRARHPAEPPRGRKRAARLVDASEGRADDHGDPLGRGQRIPQRGRLESFAGGLHEEPGGAAVGHAAGLPPAPGRRRHVPPKLLDLSAPRDAQVADREALDLADARDAGDETGPERVEILSDGSDGAGAGDRDRCDAGSRHVAHGRGSQMS